MARKPIPLITSSMLRTSECVGVCLNSCSGGTFCTTGTGCKRATPPKNVDRDSDHVLTLLRAWGEVTNVVKGPDGKHWRQVEIAKARAKMLIPKGQAGTDHLIDHLGRLAAAGYFEFNDERPGWGRVKLTM